MGRKPSAMPWTEKLHMKKDHQVKRITQRFADIPENSNMLIATPAIFDAYIRQIPKGQFRSIKEMRRDVAQCYEAHDTCPVTTGIFVRIVAEAAVEQFLAGVDTEAITPFWRILDAKASIVQKLSFDVSFITEQRMREGTDSME